MGIDYNIYETDVDGESVLAHYPLDELKDEPMMDLIVFLRSLGIQEGTGVVAGDLLIGRNIDNSVVDESIDGMVDLFDDLLKTGNSMDNNEKDFKTYILNELGGRMDDKVFCFETLIKNLILFDPNYGDIDKQYSPKDNIYNWLNSNL